MRRPPARATEQNEAGMAPEKCQSQHPDWADPPPEQRGVGRGSLVLRRNGTRRGAMMRRGAGDRELAGAPVGSARSGKRCATNKPRGVSPPPGCGRTRVGFGGLLPASASSPTATAAARASSLLCPGRGARSRLVFPLSVA
jgi:hypothetical protein